ncbi:MAG: DUF4282 domain-containing protein [Phycisphaeraceae bacterium]
MDEFLSFRKMITPTFIQAIFWIGVVVIVLIALSAFITGLRYDSAPTLLTGFVWLILGPILWRIYCELLIIIFRIHDVLTEIRDGKKTDNIPSATKS